MERITFTQPPQRPTSPVAQCNSERAEVIKTFLNRLNTERLGTKYKKLTAKFIAVKLGHLSLQDMHYLMKICERGDSFSKVFFGSLKNK